MYDIVWMDVPGNPLRVPTIDSWQVNTDAIPFAERANELEVERDRLAAAVTLMIPVIDAARRISAKHDWSTANLIKRREHTLSVADCYELDIVIAVRAYDAAKERGEEE